LKDHRLRGDLEPGERVFIVREMEKSIKGYRDLHKEIGRVRIELDQQRAARNSEFKNSKTYQTSLYKSVVGTRTTKLSGGLYLSNPVARETFFSDMKCV